MKKKKVKVLVVKAPGTNCHLETAFAFELAGAEVHIVPLSALRSGKVKMKDYQILVFPGGFAHGDAIASAKVLAVMMMTHLGDDLREFLRAGKLVLGICNGFQALIRMGILPYGNVGEMDATLTHNTSGLFQCEEVKCVVEKSCCVWTRKMQGRRVVLPAANGEGNFRISPEGLEWLRANRQIVFSYEENPNGSVGNIAGICDETGKVLGLMPHPERRIEGVNDSDDYVSNPNWRRFNFDVDMWEQPGMLDLFRNGVEYAEQM